MALAKALGLNPRLLYNVVRTASGDSFMCKSTALPVLTSSWPPYTLAVTERRYP